MNSMAIPQPLHKLLSRPVTAILVFIIAAVALNTWQLILPQFHFDNSFGLGAAKNIVEGRGYATTQVFANDLGKVVYDPLGKWPPGYSWLLAGIMKLSGTDAITALYIVNGLAIVLFLAGVYIILLSLRFPPWARLLFMLYAGFFPYPFLGYWFADLVAVAFYTLATALVIHANTSGRQLLIKSLIAALLCSYCIFLKYLYLPIAILPLLVWAWFSLRRRKMLQFRAALTGSAIITTAAILLVMYQSNNTGQAVYINPTGRGFFPEHTLRMGPLVPASLADQEFLVNRASQLLHIRFSQARTLLAAINYVLLAMLVVMLVLWWKRSTIKKHSLYVYMVLALSIATGGMLLFLSLTFAPYQTEFVIFWTYVQELRYYGIVVLFIQQLLFWYFVLRGQMRRGIVQQFMRFAMIGVMLFGIVHGAYHLTKRAVVWQQVGLHKKNEQTVMSALEGIRKLQQQYPDLIICSNYQALGNIATLTGAPVLYDYEALNKPLNTSRPVMLVAILRDDYLHRFTPFIDKYKAVKVDHRYNFSFYLAAIR
jgi:hypothetical protein